MPHQCAAVLGETREHAPAQVKSPLHPPQPPPSVSGQFTPQTQPQLSPAGLSEPVAVGTEVWGHPLRLGSVLAHLHSQTPGLGPAVPREAFFPHEADLILYRMASRDFSGPQV